MTEFPERRKYQRCDTLVCRACVSIDKKRWEDVEPHDLSAGGMLFASPSIFDEDGKLYIDLYIYNMLSEFNILAEGKIIRINKSNGDPVYGIQFENMDKYQQVQLDELVKSRIKISNIHDDMDREEQGYSDRLLPQFRHWKHKSGLGDYNR